MVSVRLLPWGCHLRVLEKVFASQGLLPAAFLLLSIIFAVDCLTPRGMAVWSGYALPVLIFSISMNKRQAFAWVMVTTVLLWIGAFFPLGMGGISWSMTIINRTIMFLLFLSIYFIGGQKKDIEDLLKQTSEKLDQRARQLEISNQELESFSYSVSHDLRAPLRAIDGFSRLLVEEYREAIPVEGQRNLEVIRENAVQMGHLIDDLLSFSRLSRQAMKRRPFSMETMVNDSLRVLQPQMEGRDVRVEIKAMPVAHADPNLIKHVVTNLLGNAIKFTANRERAEIEVGAQLEAEDVVYYVKDNGVGFDEKYAEKAFGVFQRLHASDDFPGTGVGLAIVQRIVHRHGGKIWAQAEVNKGATFYFTLGNSNLENERDHGRSG